MLPRRNVPVVITVDLLRIISPDPFQWMKMQQQELYYNMPWHEQKEGEQDKDRMNECLHHDHLSSD